MCYRPYPRREGETLLGYGLFVCAVVVTARVMVTGTGTVLSRVDMIVISIDI